MTGRLARQNTLIFWTFRAQYLFVKKQRTLAVVFKFTRFVWAFYPVTCGRKAQPRKYLRAERLAASYDTNAANYIFAIGCKRSVPGFKQKAFEFTVLRPEVFHLQAVLVIGDYRLPSNRYRSIPGYYQK